MIIKESNWYVDKYAHDGIVYKNYYRSKKQAYKYAKSVKNRKLTRKDN